MVEIVIFSIKQIKFCHICKNRWVIRKPLKFNFERSKSKSRKSSIVEIWGTLKIYAQFPVPLQVVISNCVHTHSCIYYSITRRS